MSVKVLVHNLSLLPVSARRPRLIERICAAAVGKKSRGELNVVFLDRERMLAMNKEYLEHGHDTDVIAFRYPAEKGSDAFGDVYISAYQARRQAKDEGHSVLKEVLTLAAHGSLHLLGYDDHTTKGRAEMFHLQAKLLSAVRAGAR